MRGGRQEGGKQARKREARAWAKGPGAINEEVVRRYKQQWSSQQCQRLQVMEQKIISVAGYVRRNRGWIRRSSKKQ